MIVGEFNGLTNNSRVCCRHCGPSVLHAECDEIRGHLRCTLMAQHAHRGGLLVVHLGNDDRRNPIGGTSVVETQERSLWAN